ncbi:vWA domain-containing protein [Ferrimonas marina]|uniref:Ca-activated chloride channel family protein n=1 Tax=Ferrimonas marina TaxID=299255 RepID=A0A1M5VE93_9GAMM|nr:VWA domain-containing protein [Ferrimonas marina]SHH73488.1 Ca-activated chloride channel family protein [Ferrimonas marina]
MVEFAHPNWLWLLPLPLLLVRWLPPYQTRQRAIQVPFLSLLAQLTGQTPGSGTSTAQPARWQRVALVLTWLLLLLALAKPMWLGPPQTRQMSGRDLMVVVDLSGSMAAKDFAQPGQQALSRLAAVKQVLAEFAQQRQGDRLGLILFGDAAYLQAPFTADQAVWLALLDQAQVGMAGQSTHLGDALGLAIKLMRSSTLEQKVVLVLTDGNDTDSLVPPLEAAKVAAAEGVTVYMVAVGDPATVGEEALDMTVIQGVAERTGGRHFLALSPTQLREVTNTLGELEPAQYQSVEYRLKQSIHYLPVAAVLLLYLTLFSWATWRRRVHG